MYIFFGIVAVVELYYWLIYFPRAWCDGSNEEINIMKSNLKVMIQPGMPWGPKK